MRGPPGTDNTDGWMDEWAGLTDQLRVPSGGAIVGFKWD